MLTRAQIQRLAQRNRVGMQVQERDYVQHLLLALLFARSETLIFKGGTALRLVYGGSRYSEDLDFNGPDDLPVLRSLWQDVVTELAYYGVVAQLRNEWTSEVGYSLDVSFQGPLFDGRDHSKGKVRIDINRRSDPVDVRRELVTTPYDDIRPFVAVVIAPEHLLAEKVRALLVRGKPRDLYDLWLLLRQGVHPNPALIERKLELYQLSWQPEQLSSAIEQIRGDWDRDLRPLLTQYVAFEDVAGSVGRMLS